jgi:hypothetical protein
MATSAALATFLLAAGQPAAAITVNIDNKTSYDLTSGALQNRQAIEMVSQPPATVKAGQTGSFLINDGDSTKTRRMRVRYDLTDPATEAVVGSVDFGITTKPAAVTQSCFADSSLDTIDGTTNGCSGSKITYTYKQP